MGRWSTGAISTGQCLQVWISAFTKYIKSGSEISGSISWSSGASIGIRLIKEVDLFVVELSYTKTINGEQKHIKSKFQVLSVPSNLGNGEVYYFRCPFTFKKCRVLYMGYGSLYFKSREAYSHRIYYPTQTRSKLDRHNSRYFDLERTIEKLEAKNPKTHYRGKKTTIIQRIERLKESKKYHDRMRWIVVPKIIREMYLSMGLTDASKLF